MLWTAIQATILYFASFPIFVPVHMAFLSTAQMTGHGWVLYSALTPQAVDLAEQPPVTATDLTLSQSRLNNENITYR